MRRLSLRAWPRMAMKARKNRSPSCGPDQPRGDDEFAAAHPLGTPVRQSLDGAIGRLRFLRTDDAAVLAVRVQPAQPESSAAGPAGQHRLRRAEPDDLPDQGVSGGNKRPHWKDQG